MKPRNSRAIRIPAAATFVLLGAMWATPVSAQEAELYNDAWSEDTEIVEEDPPGWYWGYGSTGEVNCNPGDCQSQTMAMGVTRDTGGMVIAQQTEYGAAFASITITPVVQASMPDGDYPLTTDHSVRYIRNFEPEEYNWWQFIKDNILFKGINNRYVYSTFEAPNRWIFVRDECHATCQNDSQYVTTDPNIAAGNRFLHRKVKRVSIFGIGKCFNARLVVRNYRGVCTT